MPVALITGGSSGIGAACVSALGARGVRVAVADRADAGNCELTLTLDVRDPVMLVDAVVEVESVLGPIDHLVTAAGYYETPGGIGSIEPSAWREMLDVHVGGTVNAWRAVLPGMCARGRGSVCAIGSELGLTGDPRAAHYAAAKGAIHAMSKSLAVELARQGIRVNCVAPGPTDTPLLAVDPDYDNIPATMPLGRLLTPEEIAAAVCFVLIEDTNLLGQVVSPNGGAVI